MMTSLKKSQAHTAALSAPNPAAGHRRPMPLDLEGAEEPEIKLATSAGSSKKQESSRKTFISALLTIPKPFTLWIKINCGEFLKKWDYQAT